MSIFFSNCVQIENTLANIRHYHPAPSSFRILIRNTQTSKRVGKRRMILTRFLVGGTVPLLIKWLLNKAVIKIKTNNAIKSRVKVSLN